MIIEKEALDKILLRNSARNNEIFQALERWSGYASGKDDFRSGPLAADVFQDIASEYDDGCVVLAILYYWLSRECGESPREYILSNEIIRNRLENISKNTEGAEKDVVDWFLAFFKN